MAYRYVWGWVVGAGLLAGCGAAGGDDLSPDPRVTDRTVVDVDNQGFLDMTVYAVDGIQRVRLGVAQGHTVTPLTIPTHMIQGTAALRFYGDPVGANNTPVSDEIVVYPGDQMTLIIPSERRRPRA